MKLHSHLYRQGAVTHCYQRTVNGFLIFYTVSDFLVFYTLVCTLARKYRIRLYKICLMPDHYHLAFSAGSFQDMERFIQAVVSRFTKAQNKVLGRTGALWESPFGYAPKFKSKSVKSLFIYIDNNPVERQLCKKAEEYRWNFLAYAISDHPFSRKMNRSRERKDLRYMLDGIDRLYASGKSPGYDFLDYHFPRLDVEEKRVATDYIIHKYSVVDYEASIRFFGSYKQMLTAIHSTSGNEYDIHEVFTGRDDRVYRTISQLLTRITGIDDIHRIIALPLPERERLFQTISKMTDFRLDQAAKYLRIPRLYS